MKEYLTSHELAELLKLNPVTITRKAKKGEIPAVRIGKQFRFDRDQIEQWMLSRSINRIDHILVIDDEPVIGRLFKDVLERNGYHVTTFLKSSDVLNIISRQNFDLMFVDLMMPEMDGAELIHRIRDMGIRTPIVIVTGYPDSKLMERVMERGPFVVIKKPFSNEDILNVVSSFSHNINGRS